jgi:hypothetical protein
MDFFFSNSKMLFALFPFIFSQKRVERELIKGLEPP